MADAKPLLYVVLGIAIVVVAISESPKIGGLLLIILLLLFATIYERGTY